MIVISVVLIMIGLLYFVFPNVAWMWGSYTITSLSNSVANEEIETIRALSKRRSTLYTRLFGILSILLGLLLYLLA